MGLFNEEEIQYLINIKKNNPVFHNFNYKFICYITSKPKYLEYFADEEINDFTTSIIERVNDYISYDLYEDDDCIVIINRVIYYLLKTTLEFNVNALIKERDFVNIIQYVLYPFCKRPKITYGHNEYKKIINYKIERSRGVMNDLISALFFTNERDKHNNPDKLKEDFRNQTLLIYDLLVNELVKMYNEKNFYINDDEIFSDHRLLIMKDELLIKHHKTKKTKKTKKVDEIKESTPQKEIRIVIETNPNNADNIKSKELNSDEIINQGESLAISKSTNQEEDLRVGNLDVERTKKLYDECNKSVFKFCTLKDFVNSLNNPNDCNLQVNLRNQLYVLYSNLSNFYESDVEEKIQKLNEKLEIKSAVYSRKKYPCLKPSSKQTEFDKILMYI